MITLILFFQVAKKSEHKVKLPSVGVFRRTGRASAGVATGRRVFSLLHPPLTVS